MLKNEIERLTDNYLDKEREVEKKSHPLADIFGFRGGPKYDPCHEEYHNAVIDAVNKYLEGTTDETEMYEAAEYVLSLGTEKECNGTCKWTLVSTQVSLKPLVPLLTAEHREALRVRFEGLYRKKDRVPIQDDLYKLLKS